MGDCKHCGEKAGFLRSVHSECAERYAAGRRAMVGRATEAAMGRAPLSNLPQELAAIAAANFVPQEQVYATLSEGLDAAVDLFFEDGLLTQQEEQRLRDFMGHFSLNQGAGADTRARLTQGAVLREVCEGKLPRCPYSRADLPFNFQKSENPVWAFFNVDYYERRTRRIRQGVSQGVSIRVMRGLYYQPRVFRSESVERNVTEHVDAGIVAVTDKHIYFRGQEKSFRIPYARIVSFDGYADGFSLVRDAQTARPQIFATGDGWFAYNLVTNLAEGK